MFNKKTTFILGAGSSVEIGYPLGSALIKEIINLALIIYDKHEVKEIGLYKNDKLIELVKKLEQLGNDSIDQFLAINPEFENEVRTLICAVILLSQDRGVLETDNQNIWLFRFFHSIYDGYLNEEEIRSSIGNLKIITFNYDMSLEYFLYQKIKATSVLSKHFEYIKENLKIYHVYGSVYSIEDLDANYKRYNQIESILEAYKLINQGRCSIKAALPNKIKELTENNKVIEIRSHIENSDNIVILGYGFNKMNNELLDLTNRLLAYKETNEQGVWKDKKNIWISNYQKQNPLAEQFLTHLTTIMHDKNILPHSLIQELNYIAKNYFPKL